MGDFEYRPMDEATTRAISLWRYDPPYNMYNAVDIEASTGRYLEPDYHYYSVWQRDELIAFRCFGEDARVSGGDYAAEALDMGGGLRPDLTGQGMGASIMRSAFDFALVNFEPNAFRCTVAGFNLRAQKVCLKVGYQEMEQFTNSISGKEFVLYFKSIR